MLSSSNLSRVVMAPASSAAAMVNAFITDPGSYMRETAGLVNSSPSVVAYWLASYDGKVAMPSTAPVLASMTTPVTPAALFRW